MICKYISQYILVFLESKFLLIIVVVSLKFHAEEVNLFWKEVTRSILYFVFNEQ